MKLTIVIAMLLALGACTECPDQPTQPTSDLGRVIDYQHLKDVTEIVTDSCRVTVAGVVPVKLGALAELRRDGEECLFCFVEFDECYEVVK